MKKARILNFLIILLFVSNKINCQIQQIGKNEVYKTENIIFYGYDFSNFRLSDPKRIGQDLKKYIFTLIGFLAENLPEKKLAKWLDKENLVFNLVPTVDINKKINNEDIASPIKHDINKDSINSMIKKYVITEKKGIGYVIIFECFDNNTKRVSAYSVFFDIATKNVLLKQYASTRDGNSYNRISDWNVASIKTIKELTELTKNKINQSEVNFDDIIVKSEEEKTIENLVNEKNYSEMDYVNFEEVKVGDIIKFKTSFGETIFGVVINKNEKKSIEFNTYPSVGQPLLMKEKYTDVKHVIKN